MKIISNINRLLDQLNSSDMDTITNVIDKLKSLPNENCLLVDIKSKNSRGELQAIFDLEEVTECGAYVYVFSAIIS